MQNHREALADTRDGQHIQPDELHRWETEGVAVVRDALSSERLAAVSEWVDDLESDAPKGAMGIHHWEQTDAGPVIARTERFVDAHPGLDQFVRVEAAGFAEAASGQSLTLFKEKINYKQPGGAGFAPHQDSRAYRFAQRHISVMVPLDPSTEASGCLWFAPNPGRGLLPAEPGGRIEHEVAEDLDWYPVEVHPGDIVVFDSLAPHRSGTNTADRPRRAMYLTYNPSGEGDLREQYYADKEAEFASADGTFGGERVRMSISDDFLGRPVDADHRSGDTDSSQASDPVGALAALYASPDADRLYDEAVTEREHGLQAGVLARRDHAPDALVAASLLHDVGHLLIGDNRPLGEELERDLHHEGAGASWLRGHFGPAVAEPVALHVAAKRYLCAVEPSYLAQLTPSSLRSLGVQGGPMTAGEVEAFEANPRHSAAVQLRRYDDLAKVKGAVTPPFEDFEPMLRDLAARHTAA